MPTPFEWLSNTQSNTGTADTPTVRQSEITGLANGNYLVSWVEDGTTGVATDSGQDIVGQLYDAEGNTLGSAFQLNTNQTLGDQDDFEVVATADGGFVMTYRSEEVASAFDIVIERFNASGTSTYARFIDSPVDVFNPQLALNLSNGNLGLFFGRVEVSDDIVARLLGSVLTQVGSRVEVANGALFDENNQSVAVNTNGEYVMAYLDGGVGIGQGVVVNVYNTSFTELHSVTVETGLDDNADPRVVTLANGNIVVAWSEDYGGGDYDVYYAVYDQNLNVVKAPAAMVATGDPEDDVAMIALPQGGFAIAYDNSGSGSTKGLWLQVFDNSGVADGTRVQVATGAISNAELGVTVDGRILFTYTQNDDIFYGIADPRDALIETVDFDPANQSTNFVEGNVITARIQGGLIRGTTADEEFIGQAGDDIIEGRGGVDLLFGGLGDDTLTAQRGSELIGGADNDTLELVDNILVTAPSSLGDIIGNSGTDIFDLSGISSAVTVDLAAETYGMYGLTGSVRTVEEVIGSFYADVLTGSNARDTLRGGNDNDILDGGDELDTLFGEDGDDTFRFQDGDDIDNVDGGDDTDTLDLSLLTGSSDAVQIFLGSELWMGRGGGAFIRNIEVINGTQADDRIEGGTSAITVNGNGGDDTIIGSNQGDILNGGDDNDTIDGGSGADTINGGDGDDTIRGGGFSDFMDGGDGIDTLLVDEFNNEYQIDLNTGVTNFVETAVNFENVTTGNGDDVIVGVILSTANRILTNGGEDHVTIYSQNGHYVDAGDDVDTLLFVGRSFANGLGTHHTVNMATGAYSNDFGAGTETSTFLNFENFTFDTQFVPFENSVTVTGSSAANAITLAEGDDTVIDEQSGILSDLQEDSYDGGDGVDTLIYSAFYSSDHTFDLATGRQFTAADGTLDTFQNFENLSVAGSARIQGDNAGNILRATGTDASDANIINGFGGDDEIFGGGGNDMINGGSGKDILNGEDGDDTFIVLGADLLDDNDVPQVDDIIGGAGRNTLDLSDITPTSVPGVGVSVGIILQLGSWVVFSDGGIGTGQISDIDIIQGSGFDDTLDAAGTTVLDLFGNGGNDRLVGGTGDTFMDGGADDDVLVSGTGETSMVGGTGADTFQFVNAVQTDDQIRDFTIGEDKIDLSSLLRGIDFVKLVAVGEAKGATDLFLDHTQNIGHAGSSRVLISAEQDGSDTILTITNRAPIVGSAPDLNITVELWDVDASMLSLSDFIL